MEKLNASEIFSGIFGLIISCAGLALALRGIHDLYRALIILVQSISLSSFMDLLFGVPAFLIDVCFLRGAPQLVSFSYPQTKKEK